MDDTEKKNEEVDKEREEKVHEALLQDLKNKDEENAKILAEQAHPIDLAIAIEDLADEDILYFASLVLTKNQPNNLHNTVNINIINSIFNHQIPSNN